jgi:hypothetical protein
MGNGQWPHPKIQACDVGISNHLMVRNEGYEYLGIIYIFVWLAGLSVKIVYRW